MNIDARGETCPMPVIRTRKALKELLVGESLTVSVDNAIATQNLEKMCNETGWDCAVRKFSTDHYEVVISQKGGGEDLSAPDTGVPVNLNKPLTSASSEGIGSEGVLVVVSSAVMGGGDDELGAALMKSFLFALAEQESPPWAIIFYNGGAKLTTDESTAADIKRLEAAGAEVYTCGACLNYYGLSEKLLVGSATNMYAIVEMMNKAARIIRP